jgi:formate dehydrogenase subunit delta
MKAERLVSAANQIADFFAPFSHEKSVKGIADHIAQFWEPRMRIEMQKYIATTGGDGLKAEVLEAFASLEPVKEKA